MIELENVTKSYVMGKLEVRALAGVALSVAPGEMVALAGPSGSGKSTLLNLVGCIDVPTSGRVSIDGVDVTALSARERSRLRRDKLGFIFQSFNLVPVLSAAENVEIPLLLRPMRGKERRATVAAILDKVGLGGRAGHKPNELSGGERQRVAIARALVGRPGYVLADEPTANLDSETGAAVLDLMHALNRELGTAFFIATHDPIVIERVGRTIRLRDGAIVG